jgi:6-phosphogluconolactonase
MTDAGPEIVIAPDAEAAAGEAAERIVGILGSAIERRGRADWATTGGSTPAGIYRRLANPPLRTAIDWERVHLWWGDDRYVPADHPLSNALPAYEILLGAAGRGGFSGIGETGIDVVAGHQPGVPIPGDQVHPFETTKSIGQGIGAEGCARTYVAELRAGGLEEKDGVPMFDLVLLGIGPDGHLLSVFPGSSAFDSRDWAMAVPAPTQVEPHIERVTLNPAIVSAAGAVVVVVYGQAKADVIREALRGSAEPRDLPARLAARSGATWILDEPAGGRLGPELIGA